MAYCYGEIIGKIDPVTGFCPNDNYLRYDRITTLNYGEYAVVINNSQSVIERLLRFFNTEDAYRIYIMAILDTVHGYLPLKRKKTFYDQSYFSHVFSNISFGSDSLAQMLDDLGRKQTRSLQFEQSLIDDSSGHIAIDGHVIPCSSHENDLAQHGNKFNIIKDNQINLLMGYDIKTNIPLFSRIYEGGNLDKVSVKDILNRHEFNNVLFVVDRGFYSRENIKLFSSNGNQYIIPLSPNLTLYKKVVSDMNLNKAFVYEKDKKRTVIDYREELKNGKRIIIYRDNDQYMIDKADYIKNMEKDPKKYTQESYEKVKDFFGVIVIETNILDKSVKEIFELYKNRWKIETNFNHVKNNIEYKAFHFDSYYKTQGMAFIILVEGLIYSELKKVVDENIKGMTVDDCLDEAGFMKIHNEGNQWRFENIVNRIVTMMETLNIDFEKERQFINIK